MCDIIVLFWFCSCYVILCVLCDSGSYNWIVCVINFLIIVFVFVFLVSVEIESDGKLDFVDELDVIVLESFILDLFLRVFGVVVSE